MAAGAGKCFSAVEIHRLDLRYAHGSGAVRSFLMGILP